MIFIIFQVYEGFKSLTQPKIKEVDEESFFLKYLMLLLQVHI